MTSTSRFALAGIVAAAGLALSACTLQYDDGASATASGDGALSASASPGPTVTLEPLAGTTLVDPASATRATEGDGATSVLVSTFADGAIDAAVAFANDGSLLFARIPAGHIDEDIIVKPAEYAWFDGTFHSLGSTAELVPGDGFRQSFAEWTDGAATAWVESSSIQVQPYPWRIFAAGADGMPALVATSDISDREVEFSITPEPVVYGYRVYWESETPSDEVLGSGTWSASVTGGAPLLEFAGASSPAATAVGVFATTRLPGPEGAEALPQGDYRVVRVDGPSRDETLRTLAVGVNGGIGHLVGDGRWLATTYDVWGQPGIAVFSAETGEGYSVAPDDRPRGVGIELCDAALVWIEPGEDWLANTIYRLDLDTGALVAFDAPRAFRISDCNGDDVLWSQSGDNGVVNHYVTTVG